MVLDNTFPINILLNRSQSSSPAHLVAQGIHAAAERQLGGQHAADLALKVRWFSTENGKGNHPENNGMTMDDIIWLSDLETWKST